MSNPSKIRFVWQGISYLVAAEVENERVTDILLPDPDGTRLRVMAWSETSPPSPRELQVVAPEERSGRVYNASPTEMQFQVLREETVVEPCLEDNTIVFKAKPGELFSVRLIGLPSDEEIHLEVTCPGGMKTGTWVRWRKTVVTVHKCAKAIRTTGRTHITVDVARQIGVVGTTIQKETVKTFEFVLQTGN